MIMMLRQDMKRFLKKEKYDKNYKLCSENV